MKTMRLNSENILRTIREQGGAVAFRDILRVCGVDRRSREIFKDILDGLVNSGDLLLLPGQRYSLAGAGGLVIGRLSTHRDGYGFVSPEGGGADVFVPARWLRGNLNGDIVEVSVTAIPGSERREGRVVRTVERGQSRIVGRYEFHRSIGRVIPDDPRISAEIVIPVQACGEAESGQVVVAEITSYPSDRRPPMGRIVEVLGWPDDPDVEVLTVIRKYELPAEFPADALAEARGIGGISPGDLAGRKDLREQVTVTIDGETARDFDDAVSVRRDANGAIRLWVSIADVSHYVKPGSPLDREAYLRGTSVYFPDRCLPMLPEELSNGICSLKPGEDRLTLTAEMLFDADGHRVQADFYPSMIRSMSRLTYTQVARVLEKGEVAVLGEQTSLADDLRVMEELARRLMARRHSRGSLDFDLPEPEIVIDTTTGDTVSILRSERTIAHRLIEECMLAANEAVAGHLERNDMPTLFRIHEPPSPEKIKAFAELAAGFGHLLSLDGDSVSGTELQRLLEGTVGRPEELTLNRVLLRSMKQARYAAENLGHFGLAALTYTHFTSPIRRYPDLVVHRILKALLAGRPSGAERDRLAAYLPETGLHTSKRERVAMEAERELVELKRLQFMRERVGDEFSGFVTGVTGNGLFVELTEFFVEGVIPVSSLDDDYYQFVERLHALVGRNTRRLFRIGDRVTVLVASVSIDRRQIEFSMIEHAPLQQTDSGWDIDLPPARRRETGKRPSRTGGDRQGPRTGGRPKKKGGIGRKRR